MPDLIQATGLVKRYGRVTALAGLALSVSEGTVLGVLGPNGAGKTTAVSILATLITPDAGSAVVAGADVVRAPRDVRRRIGLSGQFAAVDEQLTGFENLDMIGRLYHLGRNRARSRATELLEQFDLVDAGGRFAVSAGESELQGTVRSTPGRTFFEPHPVGALRLPAGVTELRVRVVASEGRDLMALNRVRIGTKRSGSPKDSAR